ncbi:MAG: nucleoside 2-deoxyribosyltransferase domain-containing protein [Nannocystaceae bacterium]
MQVVYARQPFPRAFTRALFLAGPTPRSPEVPSWRPDALAALAARGYDGVVFVPEDSDGSRRFDYVDQVEWEEEGLRLADAIVFWIPRDLATLPGFTTNVEWGVWYDSGRAVLGAPSRAPKMDYLRHYAAKVQAPIADSLEATLDAALALIGDGAPREGGEREVPLFVWRTPAFQSWYAAQRGAGHRLDGARLHWHFRSGPARHLFCWALQVRVYVPEEARHKSGEVLITRSDIAAVLAYHDGPRGREVVLVREFRSNAATPDGFVHELPGGSSFTPGRDPRALAALELEEETGVTIAAERFVARGARQCMATLLTHRGALFSVELDADEIAAFKARAGQRFGENESERTYVEVRTVAEILAAGDVDWTNVGMILSVPGAG